MKGEVKNLSYSRFHNEWKWTFFCAERKKVCRGGLRILSAVLRGSFEPLSLPLITDNSVQRLNWNRPEWFSPLIFATLVLWSPRFQSSQSDWPCWVFFKLHGFVKSREWWKQNWHYRLFWPQSAIASSQHWDDGIPTQRRGRLGLGDLYVIFPSWKVHSLPNKLRKYTDSSINWPLTVLIRGLVWVKMASRKNTASPKYISTWSTFCDFSIIATKHLKSCVVGWVQLRFSRNKLRWDDKSNAGQNRAQ